MLDLDKSFYFFETQSKQIYQDSPTGNIDVNELIRQRPYWISPTSPERKQPKKLIIADWSARNWSEDKIRAVIKGLRVLIENGFSVEIWQHGKLVPLTKDSIASLREDNVRRAITPAPPEAIRERNTSCNQENTLILDDYWISYIVNKGHSTSGRGIKVSDYIKLSKEEQAKALTVIQQANPPLTHFIHDNFSINVNLACIQLKEQFPHLPVIKHYERINLGDFKKLFAKFINTSGEKIALEGLTLSHDDLKTITHFENLSPKIFAPELQTLLTMATKLRSLEIAIGENLDADRNKIILEEDSLSNLEILILRSMPTGNISPLLRAASNLQRLDIVDSTPLVVEILLPEDLKNLKNLEKLIFKGTNEKNDLCYKNFALLMNAASNLKGLHLENFYIPDDIQIPPTLEELTIENCIVSSTILHNFFAAPIKKIYLNRASILNKSEIKLNTKHLEELHGTGFDILTLNLFIKSAPRLKKLAIKNIKQIDNINHLDLKKDSLNHLIEIDFSTSEISTANLSTLLLASPNLKKLNLNGCTNLTEPLEISSSQTELEEFNASSSNISGENLQTILTSSPKLKKLNLANCVNLKAVIQLPESSLIYLEEFILTGSHIHTSSLQALLLASPNLKELNLSLCSNILPTDGLFNQKNFSNLEILHFNFNRTSAANLKSILTTAANLKNLSLNGSYLTGELTLTQGSLGHLEKLELSPNALDAINLGNLLRAAPNIKELDLKNSIDAINSDLNIQDLSLKNLEKITLIPSNSNNTLQSLLTAAPNLKTVELHGGHGSKLIDKLALAEKSLKQLEELTCTGITFSHAALQTWLKAAPNLKTLTLRSCSLLLEPRNSLAKIELFANSLLNLKDLNLSESDVSLSSLLTLLHAAPNIVTLDLSLGKGLLDPIKIKPNSLMHLKEVNLSITNISVENLKVLLRAAPNLKKIHLSGSGIDNTLIDEELEKLLRNIETIGLKEGSQTKTKLNNSISQGNNRNKDSNVPTSKEASSKQETTSPIDPPHNPANHREHTPTPNDFEFQFRGNNQTKNQGMIIEKLSQYLTLKNQHLDLIPQIQDGICDSLAHLFKDTDDIEKWNKFIEQIANWNGEAESLTSSHERDFDKLHTYIKKYQNDRLSFIGLHYLGDNLTDFLAKLQKPAILTNPWHAIAIRPIPNKNTWLVYDPNFVGGAREVHSKELVATIHQTIGRLVSVEAFLAPMKPKINDPLTFLEEGGLLTFVGCAYSKQLLDQLITVKDLSIPALEGLLLRDTEGMPAWVIGLKHPKLNQYTQTMLQQFVTKIPDPISALQGSIAHLSKLERQAILTHLLLVKPLKILVSEKDNTNKEKTLNLTEIVNNPDSLLKDYEKLFATWKAPRSVAENLKSYCQTCVQPEIHKKRLIKVNSSKEVEALNYVLENHCQITSRPVFRIESPEDLLCASPYVAYDETTQKGKLCKGPGGRFYDFLQKNQSQSPIILVNYDRFSASDLVRFNSLLDEIRTVDTIPLPKDALVIGVMNTKKPDCYQGSDFYSRFDVVETCPIHPTPLAAAVPRLPITEVVSDNLPHDAYIINLYQAPDWENQLLGHWILTGDQLTFQKGELAKALESGKSSIQLHNAPWQDESFIQFWQDAYLRKYIQTPGPRLAFSKDKITVTKPQHEGYNWAAWQQQVTFQAGLTENPDAITLNPTLYSDFLSRYRLEEQAISHLPGLIEAAKDDTLVVNFTRALGEHEWARLLNTCQNHKVKLIVHYAPGVEPPSELAKQLAQVVPSPLTNWTGQTTSTQILVSTDLDTTTAMMTKDDGWTVIDVSECKPSDLLYRLQGDFKKDELRFEFKGEDKALLQALACNKKVILKGTFSSELRDALTPLLIKRLHDKKEPSGQLILITDKPDDFHFANPVQHTVTIEEKQAQLGVLDESIKAQLAPYLEGEPLSQLNARLRYLSRHPTTMTSDNAWMGLYSLPMNFRQLPTLNLETSAEEATAFIQARRNDVNTVLANSPFVFLTGLSGVGKSTFVEHELLQKKEGKLHIGESKIEAWARSTKPGRKILFLDEANLSKKKFSEFEGLFNNPPSILINGALYPLTSEHKVIFAGNPLTYGDERQLAPFFQRHGNTVTFSPLPPAVLYEKILKPVFVGFELTPKHQQEISQSILEVYRVLCTYSTTDILITPRELQMIALLVMSQYDKNPNANVKVLTKQVIYEVVQPLVPTMWRNDFSRFKPDIQEFPESVIIQIQQSEKNQFTITPSRRAIVKQLEDLLDLCELRSKNKKSFNEAQAYGGLGGIIIEGEPGIGKSELLQMILASHGYKQVFDDESTSGKIFYVIAPSLPFAEKEKLLLRAFNDGAKVILEEVNSSPMMEHLLNSLLMGKTLEGKPPTNPGFMIFGTQNPTTMAGRRTASTALSRRLITTTLTPYHTDEMVAILASKGLPGERARVMVQAFENQVAFAKQHHLSPAPNFRHLIHSAKKEVEQLNNSNKVQENVQLLNPKDFLIKVIENYTSLRDSQAEVILPFQYTKKQKQHAAQQLIDALKKPESFISSADRKVLLDGTLFNAIQNVLKKEPGQNLHTTLNGATRPFTSVNDLIDFLNQRSFEKTLQTLLQDYKNKPAKEGKFHQFFGQSKRQLDVVHGILHNFDTRSVSITSAENVILMQGILGDQIKELKASYERYNGTQLKNIGQFFNNEQKQLSQGKQEQLRVDL